MQVGKFISTTKDGKPTVIQRVSILLAEPKKAQDDEW